MNVFARAALLMMAFALAACANANNGRLQGWVEADFVFVGPDEAGRVETLNVREGDTVETGAPLFAVDADLQRSDLQMQEAAVTNAQQAHDRAVALLKTSAGTQKALEDAEAALRTAKARLNSSQTRLARRKLASPLVVAQPRLLSPLELDSPATVFTMENVLVSGVLGNGVTVAQQTLDLLV